MKRWLILPAIGLCTLVPAFTAAQSTPPPAPTPSTPAATSDDRLVLDYPLWKPQKAGKALGLSVRYRVEGNDAWASAKVEGEGPWRVTLPSRPEVGVKVTLESTYRFAIPPDDLTALNTNALTAANAVLAVVLDELKAQAGKDDDKAFSEAVAKKLEKIGELDALSGYWTEDGKSARAELLSALGLTPVDDGKPEGTWTGHLNALRQLGELEALSMLETPGTAEKPDGTKDSCKVEVDKSQPDPLAVVKACVTPANANLVDMAQKAATQKFESAAKLNDAFTPIATAALQIPESEVDPADANKTIPNVNRVGVLYGIQRLKEQKVTQLKENVASSYTRRVSEKRWSLIEEKPSDSILQLAANRRWYDVSTGMVYLGTLDEFVVPTMLAICPWQCLKSDAGFGDYWFTKHTISIDVGVRAARVGTHNDPRDTGSVAFLYGASWNPIDIIRFSVGGYSFENSQTGHKNTTYYAGLTVNVIRAAELLGAIGFSDTPKASVTAK